MFKIQIVTFSVVLAHNKYSVPLWDTTSAVQFGMRAWICMLAQWRPGTWGSPAWHRGCW